MAIKAGQLVHIGQDTVVLDRVQTGGPTTVNIPTETVYELGDYQSVGQVRDIPDLTFTVESYDVTPALEFLALGKTTVDNSVIDPASNIPIDFRSIFKAGQDAPDPFLVVNSVGIPAVYLESLSYRLGMTADARKTATFRGDSIYYNPGMTYVEETPWTTANQVVTTANPAYGVTEQGQFRRVLNVMAGNKRLVFGVDYTESYGAVSGGAAPTTITLNGPAVSGGPLYAGQTVRVMYSSPTGTDEPQNINAPASSSKPAAIRGRDIWVYLGGYDSANKYQNKVLGVQAVQLDWKVKLDKNEEFGNYHLVSQDFFVPDVNGTIQVRAVDVPTFLQLMQEVAGTTDPYQSAAATNVAELALDIVLTDPATGTVLERLHVPDAIFEVPGFQGRVQQKIDVTIKWNSLTGQLKISES